MGDLGETKLRYIASIAIVRKAFKALKDKRVNIDQLTLDRYRLEIRRELQHLNDLVMRANVKQVIVAPVTIPSAVYRQRSNEHRIAVEALNDELRQFAGRQERTTFFDTIRLLESHPDADMFLDSCCHLTERGNDLVAGELTKILTR